MEISTIKNMEQSFKKTFEVHLYETKHNQQLNPVKLIDYLNDTAGSHSESLGYSLESLYKKEYSWILLSWNIGIDQLPQLREKIDIETWISQTKRCFAYREFLIRNNQNKIIVRASSQWIFYNINKKKPAKIFSEFSNLWTVNPEKACNQSIIGSSLLKQTEYQNTENTFIIQQKDIDILDHVHNSKYIDWVIEIKPGTIQQQYILKHLQILYHHEIKYPGEVIIKQQIMSSKNNYEQLIYDLIWDKNEKRISTEVATQWEHTY
jgi:medium-chain acyl-[acyl-carrier-protein] hydrolase